MLAAVWVRPERILRVLESCPFSYPRRVEREELRGWGQVAVFDGLFRLMVEKGDFPGADKAVEWLLGCCEVPEGERDEKVLRRAHKLYLDFAREMHAMGLLITSGLFDCVQYRTEFDMADMDFVVTLDGVWYGIQSAMRPDWKKNGWTTVKDERRERRVQQGQRTWMVQVFWMTNERIPHVRGPAGVWLFTPRHVEEVHARIVEAHAAAVERRVAGAGAA